MGMPMQTRLFHTIVAVGAAIAASGSWGCGAAPDGSTEGQLRSEEETGDGGAAPPSTAGDLPRHVPRAQSVEDVAYFVDAGWPPTK
jgi:hypothetical protein